MRKNITNKMLNKRKDSRLRALAVMLCIIVNVLLSFLMFHNEIPLYIDVVGTIVVSIIGGLFPGIMTAVVTNTICNVFNSNAIYFCSVNVMIAIFVGWFAREKKLKNIKYIAFLIGVLGVFCGVVTAVIQWRLLGGPQNPAIISFMETFVYDSEFEKKATFVGLNILLNIIDKGISLILALIIANSIPESISQRIKNSGWKQKALTVSEAKHMSSFKTKNTLNRRIAFTLIIISTAVAVVLSWAGLKLYFDNARIDTKKNAVSAAEFAASIVDGDMVDEYIKKGENVSGYRETKDLLSKIRDNSNGVKYLYVLKISKDGSTFVFDLDSDDVQAYKPGDFVPIEESFKPYLDDLLRGNQIPAIETQSNWGWVVTAYFPVRNSEGDVVCYVGADASVDNILEYMKEFILRVFLILLGFFMLIIAYGLWTTGTHITYPINTMVLAVEEFIEAGNEQARLDEIIKKMRAINIFTDDEIERLYHAICNMALNQAEQLRGIRHFSESTAKMQDGLIVTMADLVENRDSDTGAHIQKTAAYVRIIGEGLARKGYYAHKINSKFISSIVRSAPLHDIGKINIPDEVLNKPGKLTDEEYEIIKTHTVVGKKIMEKAINTVEGENYLKEARNMAAYHHERWDGKGYPEGLHGEVIPLAARIMAVADVFDALTSPRVYKPAFPLEKAIEMIKEGAGTQFDPKCVEVFIEALPEVKAVLRKYNGGVLYEKK